jgi:hypothetical protein
MDEQAVGLMAAKKQRRHEIRCTVIEDCSVCGECGRTLAPGEPIWRARISLPRTPCGTSH